MDAADLTKDQLDGFSVVERVASVLSLLGCIVIIATFCAHKSFHKPINRLVFYASFGNLMTSVATLMARTYVGTARSPGCQFQAFFIQMGMPADALWTLAMAVSVYLAFYHKYDAQKLRRMELLYLGCCYGIPFAAALVFVFAETPQQGRMYGDATLWCWVRSDWDVFRIATLYGPVWVVILVTFVIYIRAGSDIYTRHCQLRSFKYSSSHQELPDDTTHVFVMTEINTARHADGHSHGHHASVSLSPLGCCDAGGSSSGLRSSDLVSTVNAHAPLAVCSVYISAASCSASLTMQSDANRDGLGPQLAHVAPVDAAPVTATAASSPSSRTRRRAAYEANSAAWSYTKCALLFFTALLVTWIPSSANRVFSLVHAGKIALPLEYASALVLPLQNFWNAIVYAVTSWEACCTLWDGLWHRSAAGRSEKSGESESVHVEPESFCQSFNV